MDTMVITDITVGNGHLRKLGQARLTARAECLEFTFRPQGGVGHVQRTADTP